MLVLHQEADPEQRETKEQHQGEHNPTATANLCHRVWGTVSCAVRASVLGDILAHETGQFIRLPGNEAMARGRPELRVK